MYQGASNHEELHNMIKATVMIRRLKKDVLSELPMKRRQQVEWFYLVQILRHESAYMYKILKHMGKWIRLTVGPI